MNAVPRNELLETATINYRTHDRPDGNTHPFIGLI